MFQQMQSIGKTLFGKALLGAALVAGVATTMTVTTPEVQAAERHVWRGPYADTNGANAAGKNAMRNEGAIRYAGPVFRFEGTHAEGYYVLLTFAQ